VWQPDASKQRVRLGPGQYRGGCRDATANSDSIANWYANTCADSMRAGNANTNADGYSYTYRYSYSDSANAYAYTKSATGNTKASADSASSADSALTLTASDQ
jgi:hypothetical protein